MKESQTKHLLMTKKIYLYQVQREKFVRCVQCFSLYWIRSERKTVIKRIEYEKFNMTSIDAWYIGLLAKNFFQLQK